MIELYSISFFVFGLFCWIGYCLDLILEWILTNFLFSSDLSLGDCVDYLILVLELALGTDYLTDED
jgi:hypothetical protein